MVKPPLRTKSIGFKVSEEEYAQLETAAQATVGRSGSGAARRSCGEGRPAMGRSGAGRDLGVRLLLVNVLGPLAAGEKLTPEKFNQLLDQISEIKHQLAAKLQQAARKKPQPEKTSGDGKR